MPPLSANHNVSESAMSGRGNNNNDNNAAAAAQGTTQTMCVSVSLGVLLILDATLQYFPTSLVVCVVEVLVLRKYLVIVSFGCLLGRLQ